jgi:hypothetical protein
MWREHDETLAYHNEQQDDGYGAATQRGSFCQAIVSASFNRTVCGSTVLAPCSAGKVRHSRQGACSATNWRSEAHTRPGAGCVLCCNYETAAAADRCCPEVKQRCAHALARETC